MLIKLRRGRSCFNWFNRFKSGDFDLQDKERPGGPKKIEDAELQELLDENPTQTQKELALQLDVDRATIFRHLHAMGKIRKLGKKERKKQKESNQAKYSRKRPRDLPAQTDYKLESRKQEKERDSKSMQINISIYNN